MWELQKGILKPQKRLENLVIGDYWLIVQGISVETVLPDERGHRAPTRFQGGLPPSDLSFLHNNDRILILLIMTGSPVTTTETGQKGHSIP